MSDDVDKAQEREQRDRDAAIAATLQRVAAAHAPRDREQDKVCMDCGNEIEPPRLKVLPFTSRCAECAHIQERRLRTAPWS